MCILNYLLFQFFVCVIRVIFIFVIIYSMDIYHNKKKKREIYKRIFLVSYIAIIRGEIDEKKYIRILEKLNQVDFKTYNINNFSKMLDYLHLCGFNNAYNISMLLNIRDIHYKKISDIALKFEDIGNIFSYKKKDITYRITKIRKKLISKLKIIEAFEKLDTYDTENNPNNETILTKDVIYNEWIYYTRREIINRLHILISQYFTLEQLEYMNVELKHIIEIENMKITDLEKYYYNVIECIKSVYKNWISICELYIDIEINYLENIENMEHGLTTMLNSYKFV